MAIYVTLAWLALLLAWLNPNHYFPWASFHSEAFAALGALLAAAGLVRKFASDPVLQVPYPALFFCLLALVPLAQYLGGVVFFFGDAFVASVYLACFGLSIVLGYQYARFREADFYREIAFLFLLGALLSVFVAGLQWLRLDWLGVWSANLAPGHRPFANFAQPNIYASFVAMGLLALVYLREEGFFSWPGFVLTVLSLLFGLLISQSRTPILGLFLVSAVWVFLNPDNRQPRKVLAVSAFLGVYLSLHKAWPGIQEALYFDVPVAEHRAQSVSYRLDMWWQLIQAALAKPWLGWGWNQVAAAQFSVASESGFVPLVEHSHNLLLDLVVWMGVPIGGFCAVMMGVWLWQKLSLARDRKFFPFLAIVFVFLAHAMLELPHAYLFIIIPIGLVVGVLEFQGARKVIYFACGARVWLIFVILLTALFSFLVLQYVHAEERLRKFRFESARIGLETCVGSECEPSGVFTQLSSFEKFARTPASKGMSADDIRFMEQVAQRYPYPPSVFRLCIMYLLNGDTERADKSLEAIRSLHGEGMYAEALRNLNQMADGEESVRTFLHDRNLRPAAASSP